MFSVTEPMTRPVMSVVSGRGAPPGKSFNFLAGILPGSINFSRASSGTYTDENQVMQVASADVPRFDYDRGTGAAKGLLIEEQRTNFVTNGNGSGAVSGAVGSGGSLPTGWGFPLLQGGLVATVTAGCVEQGVSGIYVRLAGTTTNTSATVLQPQQSADVSGTAGDDWAASQFVKLVAGSAAAATVSRVELREADSGGSTLVQSSASVALSGQLERVEVLRTFTHASAVYAKTSFNLTFPLGAEVDLTWFIGGVQLEEGTCVSSYIPTSGSAATRAADVAAITDLSQLGYQSGAGSFVVEATSGGWAKSYQTLVGLSSDNVGNGIFLRLRDDMDNLAYNVNDAGSSQAAGTFAATLPDERVFHAGLSWQADRFIACLDGTVLQDTDGSVPAGMTHLFVGSAATAQRCWQGHIRRLTYYPQALSELQLKTVSV